MKWKLPVLNIFEKCAIAVAIVTLFTGSLIAQTTNPATQAWVNGNFCKLSGCTMSGMFAGNGTSSQSSAFINYITTASGGFYWSTRAVMRSPSDGLVRIVTNAETGEGALMTGTVNSMGTAGGTADAITATPSPALLGYVSNGLYFVKAAGTNTVTNPTINISGLGNKTIVKRASTALAAGDIVSGMIMMLMYDGTNMQLLNPVVN